MKTLTFKSVSLNFWKIEVGVSTGDNTGSKILLQYTFS